MKSRARKLLTAAVGVGSVSYVVGCGDDEGGLTSGNLVAPITWEWDTSTGPASETPSDLSNTSDTIAVDGSSAGRPDASTNDADALSTAIEPTMASDAEAHDADTPDPRLPDGDIVEPEPPVDAGRDGGPDAAFGVDAALIEAGDN